MPVPTTAAELLDLIRKSRLIDPARLAPHLGAGTAGSATALADRLRAVGLLTPFQVDRLLRGKHRRLVVGRYRVLDQLGLGGMGEVLLAEHMDMKRRAALKVLPRDRADDPFARERFLREARAAGQLDHPNLVRAFDCGEEEGTVFLALEYVDGISLQDLVDRDGPLGPARAARYLRQAARALGYLADRGLVHRDVKPANLLVDRAGVVKVLDLGLVRSEQEDDDLTRRAGVAILGTADYVAPEQAMSSGVDVRADVYGLGATAVFLLTGRPPFPNARTTAQKLIAHQVTPARRVDVVRPEVPAGLADVVARMLAKKPADRFQTPNEVVDALASWVAAPPPSPAPAAAPAPVVTRPVPPAVRPPRPPAGGPRPGPVRRRVSLALAFGLTLAIAAWDVAILSGAVPRPAPGRLPTGRLAPTGR